MPRTLAAVPDLDQELDDLYGLPPEDFVAARNDLAARLRKAGQAEAAEGVRALRKPSVAVWAVNQLARGQRKEISALIEAGERLRRAQKEAFGGKGGDAVREATAVERAVARTLTHHAQELLLSGGRPASQQTLERIARTLRTAAVEPEIAPLLAAGRLAGELDSPGFAAVAELAPPKRPSAPTAPKRDDAARKRELQMRRRQLSTRVDRLEQRLREQDERVRRTEASASAARERADELRAELAQAQAELEALA